MLTKEMFVNVSADITVRSYSGRGMFGKQCLAITGSNQDCIDAMYQVIKNKHNDVIETTKLHDNEQAAELENHNFHLLLDEISQYETDSMGRGVVFYWPDVEFDTSEDDIG